MRASIRVRVMVMVMVTVTVTVTVSRVGIILCASMSLHMSMNLHTSLKAMAGYVLQSQPPTTLVTVSSFEFVAVLAIVFMS